MRVVSFVPSWTETLIAAGVNVVGRTRFCIHPADQVKPIPIVGGTKQLNLEEVIRLQPDVVIFDQEENNLEMFVSCKAQGLNCYATHVVDLKSCGHDLIKLGELLNQSKLIDWGVLYLSLKSQTLDLFKDCILQGEFVQSQSYEYVIWQKPFMVVSRETFIGDVLSLFGVKLVKKEKKYPEISEQELKKSFCLFSSEPFPFAKYFSDLEAQGFKGVLVDGEYLSWYGVRTLRFLKAVQ